MRTTNPPRRNTFDLSPLRPGDLEALTDEDFRMVVDADIKRSAPSAQPVPAWITTELRTTLLERWFTTLRRTLESVDGQLEAKDAEYEAAVAGLKRRALQGDPKAEIEAEELSERHHQVRSRRLRFRSGLKDVMVEADALRMSRIRQLEAAIRAHRDDLMADPTTDPSSGDETLWSVLDNYATK